MKWNVAFLALILLFALLLSSLVQAQETDSPDLETLARDTAKTILDKAGNPNNITFSLENRSTISPADAILYRKAIEKQFRTAKVSLVKPERAQADVKVTLSENKNGFLWVAEIKLGSETSIVMQEFRNFENVVTTSVRSKLELNDELLFVQSAHMLDFVRIDAKNILILQPDSLFIMGQNYTENPKSAAKIIHDQPWPRDMRGRLMVHGKDVEAYMPDFVCRGNIQDISKLACTASSDPWPLTTKGEPSMSGFYSPVRNFFTGAVVVADVTNEQNLSGFFTAARVGDEANALWLFAGTNGRVRLYNKLNQPLKSLSGWGSSLATLPNECNNNWLVLVTRPGDATQNDQLVAMEIVNRDATIASNPIEVNGTVDALWTAPDNSAVNAVIRNHETGVYEAHRISVRCNR